MIALMRNAMRLDPSEARYPMALAEVYNFQHTTEIDKAEPLLRRGSSWIRTTSRPVCPWGLALLLPKPDRGRIKTGRTGTAADPTSTAVRSLLIHMYLDVGDLQAAEQLLADSSHNQSAWIPIYAYRHEWQKAAAIMYDETTRANLPIPPDARYGYFAVLMGATDSTSTSRALELFQKQAGIRWQSDGTPTTNVPMGTDMSVEIGLAELMMRAGDESRARRVLEMALSVSDIAAVKYRRGPMWFTLQRARALALLGRTEEAIGEIGAFSRSGWAPDAWLLDADTVFDGLRADDRFKRVIAERHAYALRERAEFDALRNKKMIPPDCDGGDVTIGSSQRLRG